MNLALLDEASLAAIWRAARKQTGDDDAAWDCVQEAFATALAADRDLPPEETVPWLCGVARNHARHWVRSRTRRGRALKRLAERPRRAGSTLDRTALQDELAALPAKQRDAVVLRYLTGRTFAEVAEAQRISEPAAKARVRRGLAALRVRLGAGALALLLVREAQAGGWGGLAAAVTGVTMKKYVAIACLVLALLGVGIGLAVSRSTSGERERPAPRLVSRAAKPDVAGDGELETGANDGDVPGVAARDAGYPAVREVLRLRGAVTDRRNRRVAGARVRVTASLGGTHPGLRVRDDRSLDRTVVADATGAFELELPEGPYQLRAVAPDGRAGELRVAVPAPSSVNVGVRRVEPDVFLVRAVDPGDTPVAGARVIVRGMTRGESAAREHTGATGDDGIARFEELNLVSAHVRVTSSGGGAGQAILAGEWELGRARGRGGVKVVVDRTGVLEGTVGGVGPKSLEGARVVALAYRSERPYSAARGWTHEAAVEQGRYRIAGLPAGSYALSIRSPAGLRLVLDQYAEGKHPIENSVKLVVAKVAAGAQVRRDLEVATGGRVAGLVSSANGPVGNARVRITLAPVGGNTSEGFALHGVHVWRLDAAPHAHGSVHPAVQREAATGADGRYRFHGLHPGVYRVEVFAPGLTYDRRMRVTVAAGAGVDLVHELVADGVLQLVAENSYIGATRVGAERPTWIGIVPREGCTVPGLAPGEYEVAAFHSDPARGIALLKKVRVEAGKTAWVDLRGHGPVRIAGRVVSTQAALPELTVRAGSRPWTPVDAAGAFEFRSAYAWSHSMTIFTHAEGIIWRFAFPPMQVGEREWQGELKLGQHALRVVARTVDEPVAGAAVKLRSIVRANPADGRPLVASTNVATDARGEATLQWLGPGEYAGFVEFPSGMKMPLRVTLPRDEPVVVREPARGRLRVVVRDGMERPIPGADVEVYVWPGEDAPAHFHAFVRGAAKVAGRAGENGRATFDSVAVGPAYVVASLRGGIPGLQRPVRERTTITPLNDNEVTITLKRD